MDSMSTERSQNSIVSRIKVFESQGTNDTSGLLKKPEIAPRSFAPRPATAKKPVVAPKPGVSRISGDWDTWTESKSTPSKELQPQPEVAGSSVVTKPELPKKPKPGLVKSISTDFLDARSGSENSDGQKKFPVPAPRPLVPKKSRYAENPALSLASLKPIAAPPRSSASAQEKVFRSLGELSPAANSSAPALQSKLDVEGDLISFDDDVLPLSPAWSFGNPFQFLAKSEPAKEQTAQPALARKPTVIRIPAKPGKSLSEIPHSPPPLPAEKPIGNTADISLNVDTTNSNPNSVGLGRPVDGKIVPARPPPPKGAPGRPPPPKLSAAKTSFQKDALSRSTSNIALDKKPSKFKLGPKRAKSQFFKNPDPALPPRPKPGHPLYNKYMLPVPHGAAKEDCLPRNSRELSCKHRDILLLEQSNSNYLECQKGEETGRVPLSHRKIITPLADYLKSGAPHAVVLHDFPAEHADDLDLHSGEIVCLLEKIDTEWYRGKSGNRTGIFPASFVKVVVRRLCIRYYIISYCVGPRCIARFEYIGDQKDELSFSEGETIALKEYVNEEWAKGELRGASGIFPLNFVEIIEDLPGTGTNILAKSSRKRSAEWCEALHDFTAETKDDLSFKKGDYIQILEQVDSEWYRGRLNEKEGIFPAVFVQICSAEERNTSVGAKKGKAKALYDFHGENEDELSFKAGDTITELESVDEDWMSGEIQGKSGIFPKNFVQILKTP
uniref:SH3 domain containing 19 n=1 Tax=Calidris pygmaea TaxID=425635 RepID=A0A8C3JE73_9CHAR